MSDEQSNADEIRKRDEQIARDARRLLRKNCACKECICERDEEEEKAG